MASFEEHPESASKSGAGYGELDEETVFLSTGAWLPVPQPERGQQSQAGHGSRSHSQGSTSGSRRRRVSRSPSITDQPGLIPVDPAPDPAEPIRFPSPFKTSDSAYANVYGQHPASQHWQPFRPAGQDPLSDADAHQQQPVRHDHDAVSAKSHYDPAQRLLLQHASSTRSSHGHAAAANTVSAGPRHAGAGSGHYPTASPNNSNREPITPGYSLVLLEETPWYPLAQAEYDTQRITACLLSPHPDESELIEILTSHPHPLEIASRKLAYRRKFSTPKAKELLDVVEEASGDFSSGFNFLLYALVAGPVNFDAHILFRAMAGAGTNEEYLEIVLLGRTNHEIKAIAAQYEAISRSQALVAAGRAAGRGEVETLRTALEGDVRGNLRKLYFGVLHAARRWEDPAVPIPPGELQADIVDLSVALTADLDVDKILRYFGTASYHRLAHVSRRWKEITRDDDSLEQRIAQRFHRDLEDALLYILRSARDRAVRDALLLEKSLKRSSFRLGKSGLFPLKSTKQEEIAMVVVKMVWEDVRLEGTARQDASGGGGVYRRGSYLREVDARYVELRRIDGEPAARGDLFRRIQEATSRSFSRFLVALWTRRMEA